MGDPSFTFSLFIRQNASFIFALLLLAAALPSFSSAQGIPELVFLNPSSGVEAGGTLVELEGTDFGETAEDLLSINFGSEPCTDVTYVSPTAATCLSPPGSGEVEVTLETVAGTSNGQPFTYIAPPLVTSISPTSGPQQGLTIVEIRGVGLGTSGSDIVSITMAGVECANYDYINSTAVRCSSGKSNVAQSGSVIITTLSGGEGTSEVNYAYNELPRITSITPNNGPYTGGTQVHINGTNLGTSLSDLTSVTIQGLVCSSLVWISSSQVTCQTPVSIPNSSGPVVLTNKSGGTSNNSTVYTYNRAPRMTSMTPSNGPTAGGTFVILNGTDFGTSRGDIVSILFGTQACTNITYYSSSAVSCYSPANPVGSVNVTLTTHSGGPNLVQIAYTYNPVPVVTAVDPDHGPLRGGTKITISGMNIGNFASDVEKVMIHESPCIDINFLGPQGLRCTTSPSEEYGPGAVVVYTYAGGQSNSDVYFNYVRAPHVDDIDPLSGPQGGGTLVEIFGESFGESLEDVVEILVADVKCENIEYISSTNLKCVTGESPVAGRGPVLVTTQFGGQGTSSVEYTYNLAPYISEVEPTNGPMAGGTHLTIFGNNLGTELADIVSVTVDSFPCTNIALVTEPETAITCTTSPKTSGFQLPGPVIVTTFSGGESNTNIRFTYKPAPKTTSITPSEGPEAGGTPVVIQGANLGESLEDIVDVTIAGSSCKATLVWLSKELLNCTTSARGSILSGPVVVTTLSGGNGSVSDNAIFTFNLQPVVKSISPEKGQASVYTTVTITGTSLGKSFEDVVDVVVAGESCLFSLVYRDDTTLMCMVNPTNFETTGEVMVTTASGGSSKSDVSFTYEIGCYMLASENLCQGSAKRCYWCVHAFRCLENQDSCVQSRTASTVTIVVLTTTALVGILTAALVVFHFANRDDNLMRDLKNNKLGPSSKRIQNSDTSDTDSDHSVVVERYEGGDETVAINESDWNER